MHPTLAPTLNRSFNSVGQAGLAFGPSARRMHDQVLAFVPRQHYRGVLELGCGTGALGRRLAMRADSYLGLDADPAAIREALSDSPAAAGLEFHEARLPEGIPDRSFDLVVVRDMLHDLPLDQIRHLARRIRAVAPLADILCLRDMAFEDAAEAFRPPAALGAALGWPLTASHLGAGFRIDVFEHEPAEA